MKRMIPLDGDWSFRRITESTVDELAIVTRKGQERRMKVPGNWTPEGEDFAGSALYTREFQAPALAPGQAAFIRVKGSDYFTLARLNDKVLGRHEGYFQTYDMDATAALRDQNRLDLFVISPKENKQIWPHEKYLIKGIFNHHDARPGSWDKDRGQDGNTGGLWGGVELVIGEGVLVKSLRVTPVRLKDGRAVVELRLSLFNLGEAGEYDLDATFDGQTFKAKAEKCNRLRQFLPRGASEAVLVHTFEKPRWWWTWDQGTSDLYRVTVTVSDLQGCPIEQEAETFGLREIKVTSDWEFFLNGRKFFPRGSNIIPTQYLSQYGETEAKCDVALMRKANLNTIRVHAHVNRKEFYDACDVAGIMVWQDFALQWSYERSDAFMQNACRQIKDMVRQFYNHPSICVWCCHNEPSTNREELDPVLAKAVAEEDSSRFVDAASDFHYHPYPGWYWLDSTLKDSFGAIGEPTKFVSEFGAQALPSVAQLKKMFKPSELWPPNWDAWALRDFQFQQTFNVARVPMGKSLSEFVQNSQSYQARLVKDYVESLRIRKYKPVNALFHFMFVDCWPAITWSVLDVERNPKLGYFALQTACQPLLPIWRNMTPQVNLGENLNWGGRFLKHLVLVNDWPKEFRNLRVELDVTDPRGKVIHRENQTCPVVPADSVTRPFENEGDHHGDGTQPPRSIKNGPTGDYVVRIRLKQGVKTIAENTESIRVVPKKPCV
jgi:beta-mannosidase